MCKSKNEVPGGKRCLIHHPVTQAIVKMVTARTGADEQTVRSAMRELNKEGKDLAPVSGAEAQALVDQQAFEASSEDYLNEHDRKMQMRRLARAREEVKNGAKGSHMHVWRNLFNRVITKMKAARKIAYVGAFLLPMALASCTAGVQPGHSSTPAPSTSISQSATPTQQPSTGTGDAVVTGTTVTDELGSYKTVKLDPKSDALKFNKDTYTDDNSGLTTEQAAAAQKWVANFVATQGLDSVAIDRGSKGWTEWQQQSADKFILPAAKSTILGATSSTSDRPLVIMNDPNNNYPQLARDGGARVKSEHISIDKTEAGDYNGMQYVRVYGVGKATYGASDKSLLASIKKLNPNATEKQLRAEYPSLYNGKDGDVNVEYTLTFNYTVVKSGNSWKIAGISNTASTAYPGLKG